MLDDIKPENVQFMHGMFRALEVIDRAMLECNEQFFTTKDVMCRLGSEKLMNARFSLTGKLQEYVAKPQVSDVPPELRNLKRKKFKGE